MTSKKLTASMIIFGVVTLLTAATSYVAQGGRKAQVSDSRLGQTIVSEGNKEDAIKKKLEILLSGVGIRVGSLLLNAEAQTHSELRINWESFGKSDSPTLLKEHQLNSRGILTKTAATVRTGALPRERAFEPSTDRVLIVTLDESDNARWARLIVDPRLVRAEVGQASEMRSENQYLSKLDFIIECPDDPALKQLRFYRITWNGQEFQLELVGTVLLQ